MSNPNVTTETVLLKQSAAISASAACGRYVCAERNSTGTPHALGDLQHGLKNLPMPWNRTRRRQHFRERTTSVHVTCLTVSDSGPQFTRP